MAVERKEIEATETNKEQRNLSKYLYSHFCTLDAFQHTNNTQPVKKKRHKS